MQWKAVLMSAVLLLVIVSVTSGPPSRVKKGKSASSAQKVKHMKKGKSGLPRAIADLKRDIAALQQDNAALQQQVTELQEDVTSCLDSCGTQGPATTEPPLNTSSGGATYVRWGRTSCPEEADLVYKGHAGGGDYLKSGSAVDSLCLPEDPQYASSELTLDPAFVVGGKYGLTANIFTNSRHDIPCAVCRSSTRSSAIMIPARTSCYPGFHLEYDGYLMAGEVFYEAASEYVCVDSSPEIAPNSTLSINGPQKYFNFAVSICGTLKCPPYEEFRAMTCVICSK